MRIVYVIEARRPKGEWRVYLAFPYDEGSGETGRDACLTQLLVDPDYAGELYRAADYAAPPEHGKGCDVVRCPACDVELRAAP